MTWRYSIRPCGRSTATAVFSISATGASIRRPRRPARARHRAPSSSPTFPSPPPRRAGRHLAAAPPAPAAAVRAGLDAGCGLGAGTRMMARHYPAALVLGINISAAQAAHAATAAPAARFAAMDAAHLAVAADSVDRIHAVEAAFHFKTRLAFLHEAHRALRPGGKLVASDILYQRPLHEVPEENLWSDEKSYTDKCVSAGFAVERFQDLTQCTVEPVCNYLTLTDKKAEARVLRRAIAAYCLVIMRKED